MVNRVSTVVAWQSSKSAFYYRRSWFSFLLARPCFILFISLDIFLTAWRPISFAGSSAVDVSGPSSLSTFGVFGGASLGASLGWDSLARGSDATSGCSDSEAGSEGEAATAEVCFEGG